MQKNADLKYQISPCVLILFLSFLFFTKYLAQKRKIKNRFYPTILKSNNRNYLFRTSNNKASFAETVLGVLGAVIRHKRTQLG